MKGSRAAFLAPLLVLLAGAAISAQGLPEGEGKATVQTVCTQCHGVDVIVRQPRSADEWTEIVARMIGAGAQLSDEDYDLVMKYLPAHLGPDARAPIRSTTPGA